MIQVVYYLGCVLGSSVGGLVYTYFGPVVLFRAAGISATAGLLFMVFLIEYQL